MADAGSPRYFAISPDDGSRIDLRNPFLAAVLSWLVPGLGQIYQGRKVKGGMCMVALVAALIGGLWLGDGRVAYASWRPGNRRFAFIGQMGIGAVAIPATVQSFSLAGAGRQPLFASGWFAPPVVPGQFVSAAYARSLARTSPGVVVAPPGDGRAFGQVVTDELSEWQKRSGRWFEIGTLYVLLAGMLNVLVVFDALGGPMRIPDKKPGAPDAPESIRPPGGDRPGRV